MLPQNNPDGIRIVFDDHRRIVNVGLLLPTTLAPRELVDHRLDLGSAQGRANTGGKLMTLVPSPLAGGDCIDAARQRGRDGRCCRLRGQGAIHPGHLPAPQWYILPPPLTSDTSQCKEDWSFFRNRTG